MGKWFFGHFSKKKSWFEIKIKKCALSFLSIPHIDIVHPDQKKNRFKMNKIWIEKKRILPFNFFVYLKLTYKLSLSKEIILLWFWYRYSDFFFISDSLTIFGYRLCLPMHQSMSWLAELVEFYWGSLKIY